MQIHTEQEWQFAATDLAGTRAWLAAQPRATSERRLAALPSRHLHDTYYDSADWMIYRAGFALRLRRSGDETSGGARNEVTLKSLRASAGVMTRRTEISSPVAVADLNAVVASSDEIAMRIRELVGTRALIPLFHAYTHREALHLLEADSELPLAEIALDETSLETPLGTTRLLRVEVECINAEPAALGPWVARFHEACRLQPVKTSKFRAGLDSAGLDPDQPIDLGSLEISAAQDFTLTQLAQLRRYFVRLLELEPRVRADSAGAVHEMRVAARHLDVLLQSWRGRGPDWATRERRTLRLLVRSLGAIRDREVQAAHLQHALATLDDADRAAVQPVLGRLRQQRREMRERLLHTLDSERLRFWIDNWRDRLAGNTGNGTGPSVATGAVAHELVREQARKLRKRARRIGKDSAAEEFHEVRIRAKRLRYTLDAFEPLYGEAGRAFMRALGKLQDILGEFHDASVREVQFAALANDAAPLPSSASFVMGRLAERDRRACQKCQRKFSKAYSRVRGRRWRALDDLMQSQSMPEMP